MIRTKLQGYTALNIVQDNMILNLCDTFAVNNTYRGEQNMIMDPGAPVSLAGRSWLDLGIGIFITVQNM